MFLTPLGARIALPGGDKKQHIVDNIEKRQQHQQSQPTIASSA
jgi:hypothetical protein